MCPFQRDAACSHRAPYLLLQLTKYLHPYSYWYTSVVIPYHYFLGGLAPPQLYMSQFSPNYYPGHYHTTRWIMSMKQEHWKRSTANYWEQNPSFKDHSTHNIYMLFLIMPQASKYICINLWNISKYSLQPSNGLIQFLVVQRITRTAIRNSSKQCHQRPPELTFSWYFVQYKAGLKSMKSWDASESGQTQAGVLYGNFKKPNQVFKNSKSKLLNYGNVLWNYILLHSHLFYLSAEC